MTTSETRAHVHDASAPQLDDARNEPDYEKVFDSLRGI